MLTQQRLPQPYRPEAEIVAERLRSLQHKLDWAAAAQVAAPWVHTVRDHPAPFWAMESLLQEYPISSAEGLALMRLAEALLRVPDTDTAIALTADEASELRFVHEEPPVRGLLVGAEANHHLVAEQFHDAQFLLRLFQLAASDLAASGVGRPQRTGYSVALRAALDCGRHKERDEQQGAAHHEDPLVVLSEQLEHGRSGRYRKAVVVAIQRNDGKQRKY